MLFILLLIMIEADLLILMLLLFCAHRVKASDAVPNLQCAQLAESPIPAA